jgi:phospholipase C
MKYANGALALAALVATASCSATPSASTMPHDLKKLQQLQHIVIIVQENRSLDNLFQGYPGANTVASGTTSDGRRVNLTPVSLATQYVIDHSAAAMFAACNGRGKLPGTDCRNDGFDREATDGSSLLHPQYVFVPHSESKPYFEMAREGVLADRTFQSQLDESFVAHQYLIAAQAQSSVDIPTSVWGCGGTSTDVVGTIAPNRTPGKNQRPCFDYKTLADELDSAGLSWRFYTSVVDPPPHEVGGVWSAFQAVRHIYNGPEWKTNVITPQTKFLTDVASGKLASVTWITPICANSDHVNCGGGFGPSWVSALVNAVGKSKFWKSTAIFVIWDDWGGLYDHVPPPYAGYDGLGFRVPLVIISPYARRGHVSHVQYESTSILKFAEDTFGLSRLGVADARATSPASDCFDFDRAPLDFIPIKAPKNTGFFMHQPRDGRAPDYE